MGRNTLSHGSGIDIEFLPPNDSAFGMAETADFVGFDGVDDAAFGDDGPRSKWLPAVASVVVLGLLGGGVIAAAPWSGNETATPPSTTVPTPTTGPATTTTERVLDVASFGPPGFVIDDPGRYQLSGAWTMGSEYRPPDVYGDDWFDLWTTPDSMRTSGRWLAISTMRGLGTYDETRKNAIRIAVGDRPATFSTSIDGVSRLSFVATDETGFDIASFGVELPDLLAIAAQLHSNDDRSIGYGSLPDTVLAGLQPEVSRALAYGGLSQLGSQPLADTYYFDPETQAGFDIQVRQATELDNVWRTYLMQPVALGADDQAALDVVTRSFRPTQIVTQPDWPGSLMASWVDEAGTVTLLSWNLSAAEVIALVPQARLAGDLEWAELVDRSNRGELQTGDGSSSADQPRNTVIGTKTPGTEGDYWQIEMSDGDPASVFMSATETGWGGQLDEIEGTPTVHRFSSRAWTFLIATVEWPSTARIVRVTVQGAAPVDIPMVQVGSTPVYAAGYAFTDLAPETVEFLDIDGNPVAATV